MRHIMPARVLVTGLIVAAVCWLLPSGAESVSAQCGDIPADSSCITCHAESYPVYGVGEWHVIHARKDCCWNCHGGNTQAMQKDLAHEGMTLFPLQDIYQSCYACHPADYGDRAVRFGNALGVVPSAEKLPPPSKPLQKGTQEELMLVILSTPEAARFPVISWRPEILLVPLAGLALLAWIVLKKTFKVQN